MSVRSTDNNSLFFATGIDNSGLKKGVTGALGMIQGLASKVSQINPFAALAIGALATFGVIASSAEKLSKEYETAMKEVETISDATQKDFEGMSKAVFDLSKESPDGPVKLAKAYYQIVSAGYDGADGLKLLAASSKAAVAGVTDTKVAADGITTVLNAFKISAEDVTKVSDFMFETVKLGKTTFSELASSMSTVAPIAAASEVPFKEISSAIASLTKQGVPTAQAMTQIRAAIIGANDVLGDGWAKTMSLQNAFQLLYEKADGSQTKLKDLVGRVEAMNGIMGLAGKNAKGAAKDLEEFNNVTGATEKASKSMLTSNENEWKILGNRIKSTVRDIGDITLEMSSGIAKTLNGFLENNDKLEESFNKQRTSLFSIKDALESTNTSEEEKSRIFGEINTKYKDYLGGIKAEKLGSEELLTVLDKINDSYLLRYKFEKRQKELKKELNKQGDLELKFDNSENALKTQIANLQRIASDNGVKLKVNTSLSDDDIYKSIRKQLHGVKGAIEVEQGKFSNRYTGFAGNSIDNIEKIIKQRKKINKQLKEQNNQVNGLILRNKELNKIRWNNPDNKIDAVKSINKATSTDELAQFNESSVKEVQEALKLREKIIAQLDDVKNINSKKGLSKYLHSENKEIKKAAQERFRMLNTTGGKNEQKEYTKFLNERKTQYKNYQKDVDVFGKEDADKRYKGLLEEGSNYAAFLNSQLDKFSDYQTKKDAIRDAAVGEKISLHRDKVKELPKIAPIKVQEEDVILKFKTDTTSINAINKAIDDLEKKRNAATTGEERKALQSKIDLKKQELTAATKNVGKEKDLYKNLTRDLDSLNNKQLRNYIEYWKDRLKAAKKGSKESKEAEDNIISAKKSIDNNIADTFGKISGAISETSDLIDKFGDKDLSNLLNQLSGVASGVGDIFSGNVIEGALKVLNSAVSVEIVSDTSKYEDAIKRLEKDLDRLNKKIAKDFGQEEGTDRIDAINEYNKQVEALKKATAAEKEARKEVKILGTTVSKKGKGSGTDPAKLEELGKQAEDAKAKVEELKEQIDELLTGATQSTLLDGIEDAFQQGKTSAQDFANTFEDMMRKAMLQTFEQDYLKDASKKFFEKFAEYSDSNNDGISDLTPEEIAALRTQFNQITDKSKKELEALNDILEQAGIDGGIFGDTQNKQSGLSGAISTITEDTANVLAGTMNSIRIDVANGIAIAQQSSNHLSQIARNTSYNHHLEGMSIRLQNIENLLS